MLHGRFDMTAGYNIRALPVGATTALAAFLGITPAFAQAPDTDQTQGMLLLGAMLIVAALIYFLPSIIAFRRQHANRWAILVLNTLFGSTGLGWLGTLIWAFHAVHRSPTGNHGGESGLNVSVNDPVTLRLVEPALDRPRAGAGPRPTGDRLRELASLRDQGLIDETEYQRLRGDILSQT